MTERISTFYCSGCEAQVLESTVIQGRFYCDECTIKKGYSVSHYNPYSKTEEKEGQP